MSAEDHKQALPPGFRLGAYHVARVLGVGGFGVTYLCEHTGLAVQVAVKEYLPNEIAVREGTEVHPKSAGDREGFEWGLGRFLDEARTLARFEHPNMVRVRDCFEANHTAYIVMDYEDGEPLDALLQRHGTLTEAQLHRVLLPVVDGLRQVHAAGFLHRDIKPANIFVRRSDESPVLLDFGSARQALGRRSRSVTAIASAGYSPPEQYESDGHQGAWTDIYALSALCYRAITGDAPLEATRRQSQLLRTQTDPLPKLAEVGRKGYSPAFLEAVDQGLRVIEAERPQSLDQWLAVTDGSAAANAPAASRLGERGADSPARESRLARSRRLLTWQARCLAVAGAAAVAFGLTLYILYGPRTPEPDQAPPPASEQLATQPPSVDGADETSTESSGQVASGYRIAAEQPFTVLVEPAHARVQILNIESPYRAGMELAAGPYQVEASAPGHVTKTETVAHGAAPTVHRMALSLLGRPFTVLVEPADARVRILNIRRPYRPGMELAAGSYQVEASAAGYETAVVSTVHGAEPTRHRLALEPIEPTPASPPDSDEAVTQTLDDLREGRGEAHDEAELGTPDDDPAPVARSRPTHFTQGSHRDDVLRLQGTPSDIARYDSLGKEVWRYGRSSVEIDLRTGRVRQWSNSGNLKAALVAGGNTTSAAYFTQGSHRDDVLRLQGTPSDIARYDSLGKEVWRYGRSSVEIDLRTGRVRQWSNSGNLKAALVAGGNTTSAAYFTQGSHRDDVLRLQGTPSDIARYDSLGKEVWRYGRSSVEIDLRTGRVRQWSNSGNLKARL